MRLFSIKSRLYWFAEYIPELWYKSKNKIFNLQILLKLFFIFFQRTIFCFCLCNCGTKIRTKFLTHKYFQKKTRTFGSGFLGFYHLILTNTYNRKPVDESSPLPKNLFVVFIVIFIENICKFCINIGNFFKKSSFWKKLSTIIIRGT